MIATTQTTYDGAGRVATTHSPDGSLTRYAYDAVGNQKQVIVDHDGDLTSTTNDQDITSYDYDDAGQQVSMTDALGHTTYYEYDALGRQTAQILPAVVDPATGQTVHPRSETIYDSLGRRTAVRENLTQTDPLGAQLIDTSGVRETDYQYDDSGHLVGVTLPVIVDHEPGSSTINKLVRPRYEYDYDIYGNQTATRDNIKVILAQAGYQTEQIVYTDQRTTAFSFDAYGHQLTRTLPIGVSSATPGDFMESTVYDKYGRVDYAIDFEGHVTKHLYDSRGREIQKLLYADLAAYSADANHNDPITSNPAQRFTYTLDSLSRQTRVVDSLAGTTDQAFDGFGRLVQVASPEGIVNYRYYNLGQLERTFTSPDTSAASAITETHYGYDSQGRLKTVEAVARNAAAPAGGSEITTYYYDAVGNLDYEQWVKNASASTTLTTDYTYDAANRLTELKQLGPSSAVLADYQYTVNIDGTRKHASENVRLDTSAIRSTAFDWLYDNLGRLTEEKLDSSDDALDYTADYLFDLVGNRVRKTVNNHSDTTIDEAITSLYDANDRLLSEAVDQGNNNSTEQTTIYGYGGAGDPATYQSKKTTWQGTTVGTGGTKQSETTFGYDLQGRMTSAAVDSDGDGVPDSTSSYRYNPQGIRVGQSVDGQASDYVVDGNNPTGYSQVLEERDGATHAITKTYTLGLDVIAQQAPSVQSSATVVLRYDGHGSTRQLVDATGTVAAGQNFAYDAYGNAVGFNPVSAETTLLYSGEQTDRATGLQYLRARYLDPATGRVTTLDAFAGNRVDPVTLNKYLYANGSPVMGVDPSGLFTQAFGIAAHDVIQAEHRLAFPFPTDVRYGQWAGLPGAFRAMPDILNVTDLLYNEIKPLSPTGIISGMAQMGLREQQFESLGYEPDTE